MELTPTEFERLVERIVEAIALMPSIETGDLDSGDYLLIKDNATNQPKKISLAQLAALMGSNLSDITSDSIISELISLKGDAGTGYGVLTLKSKTSLIAFSGGATETIPVQIPIGASLLAVQLRNNTILVGAGATNYSASTTTGGIGSIGPVAFTKNAKIQALYNLIGITSIEDIVLTPDAGTLDTGTVAAVIYYFELTAITDAP